MDPSWRRYWKEMGRYLVYVPAGLAISLVPFFLNLSEYRSRGEVTGGLLGSLGYGLVVAMTIWTLFALVFAALTFMHVRTGWEWRVPWILLIGVPAIGMMLGIWFVRRFKGVPVASGDFPGAMAFGGIVMLIFILHFAYRKAKEEALAHRAVAAEARYNALEQQMRPHFLFNALNSLAELIESGHDSAAEMTHKLSDLYRLILANSTAKTSPLASELEIVRRYLELEHMRLGSRLNFSIEAADDLKVVHLPSLILQTLVENAVKHGIARSIEGGSIKVEVRKSENTLYRVAVSNTGLPLNKNANSGSGLANTRARLDLLYGDSHRFEIRSDAGGGTVASFFFTGERID